MYTITKGPSKLVAQRRTGPSQQQVESRLGELLKCRQPAPPTPSPPRAQPPGPWPLSSPGPRLVFNRVNGRRPPVTSPSLEGTQETYTLAHEENVRFVSEAWQQVEQQLGGGPAGESGPRPVQYVEKTPNPRLQSEPSPALRESPPLPLTLTWALLGSSPRGLGRALELDPLFPSACYIWAWVKGLWSAHRERH
ncbi:MAPK regulated corepressor interacting protein 2 isoform X2 [Prionailurus viverrinus]|uniref:MAPK regulated corepressor interacting protein 2 isoform X2 n=1 Tax=Prionailurus viverrinus TaxID=61388 RepID=UPI001FF67325|nr:MAPK regulated corepressor interacting protein 2 isoform X2 [Prionailurus viverrinus]